MKYEWKHALDQAHNTELSQSSKCQAIIKSLKPNESQVIHHCHGLGFPLSQRKPQGSQYLLFKTKVWCEVDTKMPPPRPQAPSS